MTSRLLLAAGALALVGCAASPQAPYAGQQARTIKALSAAEERQLLEGAGMGYAKAAELNRHPGPMHALELADRLELTAAQRAAIEAILRRHKEDARARGREIVAAEAELDRLFATRAAEAPAVEALTRRIGTMQGELRAAHLRAHLETTALLTPGQVARYESLRGYAGHH